MLKVNEWGCSSSSWPELVCMVIQGAERKNKDDAKQIGKHLERVYGKLMIQSCGWGIVYSL